MVIVGAYTISIFILPEMLKAPIVTRCIRETVGGACLNCGYDLTGSRSGVCPECGTPISI